MTGGKDGVVDPITYSFLFFFIAFLFLKMCFIVVKVT